MKWGFAWIWYPCFLLMIFFFLVHFNGFWKLFSLIFLKKKKKNWEPQSVCLFAKEIFYRKDSLKPLFVLLGFLFKFGCKPPFSNPLWLILWPKVKPPSIGFDLTYMLEKIDSCFHNFCDFWKHYSNWFLIDHFQPFWIPFLWLTGVWDYSHFVIINGCHILWCIMNDFTWEYPFV